MERREARKADAGALVETLGAAFAEDALWCWLEPDAPRRAALMRGVFGLVVAGGLQRGRVVTTPSLDGVGVWTETDVPLLSDEEAERHFDLLGPRADVVAAAMAELEACRPAGPHVTVHELGVRPEARGRGVGAALLAPALDTGQPVYLDATDARALAFYERLGFAVVGEVQVGGGGPVVHALVRP